MINTLLSSLVLALSINLSAYVVDKNTEFLDRMKYQPDYVQGIEKLTILRIRTSYVLLENNEKIRIVANRGFFKDDKIIEGSIITAFVLMKKENHHYPFTLSNRISYRVVSIDIIDIKNDGLIQKLRLYIRQNLDKLGEGSEYIKGIVFGFEDYSFYEKKQLIEAGIYHFFVASGSNIILCMNIFYFFFHFIFSIFKLRNLKLFSYICSCFLTFLYCLIVGFDPPLLRAFIFAIFVNLFVIYQVRNTLFYSLLMVSLIWVFFIFFDFYSTLSLSFKLSFLSFLGVIYIGNVIRNFLYRNLNQKDLLSTIVTFVLDNLVVNLSVMIFILPIFLEYFGVFYLNGIFSNVVIAFFIPMIFLFTLVYLIFLPLQFIVLYAFDFFVMIIQYFTYWEPLKLELKLESRFYEFIAILYYVVLCIAGNIFEFLKIKK
ncbi:MAG: ComEC/Rec2 family competence protein [bacterium]|nr:ComEC/Rec2 family competence protein [bacterium]